VVVLGLPHRNTCTAGSVVGSEAVAGTGEDALTAEGEATPTTEGDASADGDGPGEAAAAVDGATVGLACATVVGAGAAGAGAVDGLPQATTSTSGQMRQKVLNRRGMHTNGRPHDLPLRQV
jgi:hypothetical protein